MIDEAAATLRDEETGMTSGMSAELLQEKYNISREEQDQFAYESQMKAKAAIEQGKFKEEIVPVEIRLLKAQKSSKLTSTPGLIPPWKNWPSYLLSSRKTGP